MAIHLDKTRMEWNGQIHMVQLELVLLPLFVSLSTSSFLDFGMCLGEVTPL
jgi:hypothetical protein